MIRIKNELEFHNWFKKNYKQLGFNNLKLHNKGFPDFVMEKNNKEIRVELEILSSNFLLHKHDPKKVDKVICIKNDINLGIPTTLVKNIRLTNFEDKESIYSFSNQIQ